MEITDIIKKFQKECPCGMAHETAVRDIVIESGAVNRVGEILKRNGFSENLYVVADENTLRAGQRILSALSDFHVETWILPDQRLARWEQAEAIAEYIRGRDISVLSVGTGSLNDICRLAAAWENKLLCIFATAPSMDGFASYSAPIVKNSFKFSYPAKSPEVIIADTAILAAAPVALKSAGFGDMIAKYVGIADWKISALISGEHYCRNVADLTLCAADEIMSMADKVTTNDEEVAGKIFEALLKTGLGMSFMKNSRPASGSEHMVAHFFECVEVLEGKTPNLHGEDVGVCTLKIMEIYHNMAKHKRIRAHREHPDWDKIYRVYGPMADEVRKLNTPDTVTDGIAPACIEENWEGICRIIAEMPPYETCRDAMKKAGCKMTPEDIGKTPEFYQTALTYSPYMRRRLTLLRMKDMIDLL